MIKESTVEKIIDGKKYKIFYAEYDYLGGSTHIVSRMECIDENYVQKINGSIRKIEGVDFGK